VRSASCYNRDFGSLYIKWAHAGMLFDKPFNFSVGTNYERMKDKRYRYGQNKTID